MIRILHVLLYFVLCFADLVVDPFILSILRVPLCKSSIETYAGPWLQSPYYL